MNDQWDWRMRVAGVLIVGAHLVIAAIYIIQPS